MPNIPYSRIILRMALSAGLFLAVFPAGCSHYSVSGSLPSHIKTVAVPLFGNETVETGIVEDITDAVVNAIISNGSMKVVAESRANATVSGTIVNVRDEADTYSSSGTASQFKIRIIADVVFYDRVKNKVIYEGKGMEGWARYEASNASARAEAKEEAAKMLAETVIDKIVAGW